MGNIFNIETINNLRIIWLEKNIALLLLCFLAISCSSEPTNRKNNPQREIVDIKDVESLDISEVRNKKYINVDSFKITEDITDYYHLFGIGTDFNSFKNLNRAQAHQQKSFVLGTLNYKKGFLSFHTCNTPLDWDGDSEIEWYYEITYWNLKNEKRFIALTTNVETWVSEETESIAFYLHDKEGVNRVHWDAFSWNLGDFIGQQYKSLFDERIWTHPPVYIVLPEEGKEIQVELGFHEYMDNDNAYHVYDSLQLYKKESTLKFNPLTDY